MAASLDCEQHPQPNVAFGSPADSIESRNFANPPHDGGAASRAMLALCFAPNRTPGRKPSVGQGAVKVIRNRMRDQRRATSAKWRRLQLRLDTHRAFAAAPAWAGAPSPPPVAFALSPVGAASSISLQGRGVGGGPAYSPILVRAGRACVEPCWGLRPCSPQPLVRGPRRRPRPLQRLRGSLGGASRPMAVSSSRQCCRLCRLAAPRTLAGGGRDGISGRGAVGYSVRPSGPARPVPARFARTQGAFTSRWRRSPARR
jgi:hypothetical protein